jgi:hypothetical protein
MGPSFISSPTLLCYLIFGKNIFFMMVFIMFGYFMDINVGKYLWSANGLIRAIGAPLYDCFWGNILGIFS